MSALPPKADMFSVELDVCFVPLTDIHRSLEAGALSANSRLSLSIVARGRDDFRPRSFGNIGFICKAPIGQFIVAHSEVMPDGGRYI